MNSICFKVATHRFHIKAAINNSLCCTHSAMQRYSTLPSREEVLKAYDVLGVSTSAPYADVKKKYISLAKLHHPDITPGPKSDGNNNRMVDINNAYNTLSRFLKSGLKLSKSDKSSEFSEASDCRSSSSGSSNHCYSRYNLYGAPYQPWYEDLDPLLYEMMWEEMRGENDTNYRMRTAMKRNDSHHSHSNTEQQSGDAKSDPTSRSRQQYYDRCHSNRHKDTADHSKSSIPWPEADLKAMINMYQDGKSFEFIANALGKQSSQVVDEFNRWSEGNDRNHRGSSFSKQRNSVQGKGSFYHAEFPDGPPYDFYDVVDDDGPDVDDDMYGYCVDENCDDVDPLGHFGHENGPIPFSGVHFMNGAKPSRAFNMNYGKGFHKPHRSVPSGNRWKREKHCHAYTNSKSPRRKN